MWAAAKKGGLSTPSSHMVCRAIVQAVVIGKLKNRLGGHNIGMANKLLDDVMKEIKAGIKDYAEKCDDELDWWTKEGGEDSVRATGNYIFDKHNTTVLVNDRSAERFVNTDRLALLHDELVEALHGDVDFVEAHSDLSLLEIALAPELRKIFKYLSSCLHLAGVARHPAGGCAAKFAESTAPFKHGCPERWARGDG